MAATKKAATKKAAAKKPAAKKTAGKPEEGCQEGREEGRRRRPPRRPRRRPQSSLTMMVPARAIAVRAAIFPRRMNRTHSRTVSRQNIALYGGSFDPVHLGHLAVARAAAERFELARVYFVPADVQPLKSQQRVTNFYHRYAMLALALEGERALCAIAAGGAGDCARLGTARQLYGGHGGADAGADAARNAAVLSDWHGRLCADCEVALGGGAAALGGVHRRQPSGVSAERCGAGAAGGAASG